MMHFTKNLVSSSVVKFIILLSVLVLAACSGGSGQENNVRTDTDIDEEDTRIQYNGPDATTDDVTNFKLNIWDNLTSGERCGACHVENGQEPQFVRRDDINMAYTAANTIVDLSAPGNSRMVTKIAEGHHCWEDVDSVCATTITNFIEAWASDAGADPNVVVLTAPPEREVGNSLSFPVESDGFATTVWPLLAEPTGYCARCHSEDGETQQQQPYFASSDVDAAYAAARSKINLDDPSASRLVIRLRDQFHNCWDNCSANATEMQNAIQAFADGLTPTEVDEDLVISHALGLPDGVVASSGGRVEGNAIALYEFKTGEGTVAFDTSGVDPSLHLDLTGNVEWVGSWGIRINDGKAQGPTSTSEKLHELITATGEYTIEAWVVPDNVTQDGPARIVTYSGGPENRNFMLGQTLYNYNFQTRSENSDTNGMPGLSTPDADEVLQATLQHVVVTYHPLDGRNIYVNGELVANDDQGGNLNDWDNTFALAVGNEVDNQELWQGTVRFLAIHNRVLEAEDVAANFDVGVGQKFFLLFGVSHLIDMPQAYIVFEVQQFDNYSYLFNTPFFISLDDTATPTSDIPIQGLHIGLNGREVEVGQAYANLDVTVTSANYTPGVGTSLSNLGTVIALEKGPDNDQFFLSFDRIGSETYDRQAPPVVEAPESPDLGEQSDIGLRIFGEINATMSKITTVPVTTPSVVSVFDTVQQQLPTVENIDGFLAAHQAGVMQLSVAYCTALANDTSRRATYFSGFDFGESSATAFDASGRQQIMDPLLEGLVNYSVDVGGGNFIELGSQASAADIETHLNSLFDDMSAADTQTTVIAVCAAAVGSAVMLVQ